MHLEIYHKKTTYHSPSYFVGHNANNEKTSSGKSKIHNFRRKRYN